MDVFLRLGLAIALICLTVLLVRLTRAWLLARTRRTVARLNRAGTKQAGLARILYFTSAWCVQCKTRQEPALRTLVSAAPEPVAVEQFDAARDREQAARYRILTAPSTVVIGRDGRIAAINHGFAPAERLAEQLGWTPATAP